MCIAIYKPENITLFPETIEECWHRNPDGAGFMYTKENQLHVVKGLMTLAAFKEAYTPHETERCVIHFRIKTHGNKDEENTHPFLVDQKLGMVHNGIMNNVDTTEDKTKSDTWHFTKTHLSLFRKNNHRFFTNPVYKDLIESFIGFSKLIFMDNKGQVEIFNESKGTWESGCWFSNTTYKPWVVQQPQQHNRWKNKNKYTPVNPQQQTLPVVVPLKSASNPKQGDLCKTEADSVGGDGIIPEGSYVRITYFSTTHWVGIQEVGTALESEIYLPYLKVIPKTSYLGDINDDSEDLSLQTWQ